MTANRRSACSRNDPLAAQFQPQKIGVAVSSQQTSRVNEINWQSASPRRGAEHVERQGAPDIQADGDGALSERLLLDGSDQIGGRRRVSVKLSPRRKADRGVEERELDPMCLAYLRCSQTFDHASSPQGELEKELLGRHNHYLCKLLRNFAPENLLRHLEHAQEEESTHVQHALSRGHRVRMSFRHKQIYGISSR